MINKHCPRYECKLVRTGTEKYQVNATNKIKDSSAACDIISKIVANELGDSPSEIFGVITLDSKLIPIGFIPITRGTLDASLVHPREVFRPAIIQNAASIVLVHNHPTGELEPSSQDREVSKRLEDSGKILGIAVIDHIIVGLSVAGEWKALSIRENGGW